MTGSVRSICPRCGEAWTMAGNLDFVYIFSHCFCADTILEYQKGFDSYSIKAVYAY